MTNVLIPVLTLVLGNVLGYWLALTQTRKRIAAEKRAEYVSEFVAKAYDNLGYLSSAAAAGSPGKAASDLTLLGVRAGFFLSEGAAQAIDRLTSLFVAALTVRAHPEPTSPRDPWKEYKSELDRLRTVLRREVDAAP